MTNLFNAIVEFIVMVASLVVISVVVLTVMAALAVLVSFFVALGTAGMVIGGIAAALFAIGSWIAWQIIK